MNTVKRKWYRWFAIPLGWKPDMTGQRWYQAISLTLTLAMLVMLSNFALPQTVSANSAGTNDSTKLLQFTSAGQVLGFTGNGVIIASASHMLKINFLNSRAVAPEADNAASGESSSGAAPALGRVTYQNLWNGVTVVYEASGTSIVKSTYYVEDGSQVDSIRLGYNHPIQIDENGNLSIAFEDGTIVDSTPVAWQVTKGGKKPVTASYVLYGEKEVGFSLGDYIPGIPVVIDPVMTWNTFLGGSGVGDCDDNGYAIAVDSSGNVYVAGYSSESWGSPVRAYSGGSYDGFVAKLDSSGVLQWNTFLGSSGADIIFSIAVDSSGSNVYAGGSSNATWGSPLRGFATEGSHGEDAFVAKLNASNGSLTWNTFLGVNTAVADYNGEYDMVQYSCGIAVDGSGNVYASGNSDATWQGSSPPVRAYTSGEDIFAAKLNSGGSLQWNTFLGGSGTERSSTIAVDSGGNNVYVGGNSDATWQGSLPPVRAFTTGTDVFAAKLNSSGVLQWNTFLGSGSDWSGGIAVDGSGNVYVSGESDAAWGSPPTGGAFTPDGYDETFAAQLNSSGVLQWNTFLGGGGDGYLSEIAVDGSGNVYISGDSTASWGSPTRVFTPGTDGGYGSDNAFAAKLNSSNGVLTWNTFLGGNSFSYGAGIAVDGNGHVYVAGSTGAEWAMDQDYSADASWGSPVRAYTPTPYMQSWSWDTFAARVDSSGALTWNTFLGGPAVGNSWDNGNAIAVDGSGNVYVAGDSQATWGSPVRAYTSCGGVYDPMDEGFDAFVAKLDSSGALIWNTFLGGSGADHASAIVLYGGNIYVTGDSNVTWQGSSPPLRAYTSGDYTPGVGQTPPYDAFVAGLDSSGALIWNTFLGGSGWDEGYAMAVDGSGNIYVGGESTATWGAPTQAYSGSSFNAFAAKLTSSGTLTWNTFMPGDSSNGYLPGSICSAIAVDSSGNNVYIAGSSGNWGTPVRAYGGGGSDAFAAKLSGSNGALSWNTFLGGTYADSCYGGIAVDSSGNVYVGGYSNFTWGTPVRAFTTNNNAISDGFVAKVDSGGHLTWNTFLGGSGTDQLKALVLDGSGNIYVVGNTLDQLVTGNVSWGSPVQAFTYGGAPAYGSEDAFAAKLNSNSGALIWNTFVGGNSTDYGNAIALDSSGKIYIAGTTYGTWGTPKRAFTTGTDAFAVKLDYNTPPTAAITYSPNHAVKAGTVLTITATFSQAMAVTPVPQIAITGVAGSNLPATNMTRSSATVYTYVDTVGTGDGTATVALSAGTDLAGNVVTAAPTSGATFTVDNTPPTAAITYSPNHAVKAGTSLTITATFNEAMANSPAPQIAISGANTVSATAMTMTDTTHYYYTYTVGTGDGTATVALSVGTDLAGNVVTAAPTSGANFTVDNTPPTLSPVTIASNNSTPTLAKVGDTITLSFTSSQNIQTPTVTIATHTATVSGANSSWSATYVMASGDTEGIVPFNIAFTDLAGNAGTAVTATTDSSSVTFDKTPPTAAITYSPNHAVKAGTVLTITATFSQAMAVTPVPQIAITGVAGSNLPATNMTRSSATVYTYVDTVGTGDGTATVALSAGTDLAGNVVTAAPTSGATFTVDNTPPTAAITYSPNHAVKAGTSLTITATFNEAMANSPAPQIAISGANTVSATAMTMTDTTHYYYTYTVGTGDGTATVALSTGTDLAGNVVTAAPTSGASFTVDNTPPTAAITYSPNHAVKAGTVLTITASFSQAMADTLAPQIAISGVAGSTLTATAMTKTDATHYYYNFTVGTGDGLATVALSAGTDLAGNVVTAAPSSGATFTVDNTPPNNQNTVFHSSTYKKGGASVTIVSSGDATNNVWFAPSGTTTFIANGNMTTAGGTATSILSPATDGVYVLYVIDAAGNCSAASTATLTVDNTPPTVSISAPSAAYARSGQQITFTVTYYDINFYTSTLSAANITLNKTGTANGTKAVTGSGSGGTGTTRTVTISGITGDGTLGISVVVNTAVDLASNYAPAAGPSATFTVDNTAPTNQNTVFASSVSQHGGTPVTIVSSGDATNNVWFAPYGTTNFVANGHMTTAGGTATSILAPTTAGTYNLFVIDAAGNVSAASTATLTVSP